jgi:hypothetical protein
MTSSDDVPTVNSERRTTGKKETSGSRSPRSGVRLAAIRRAREAKTARDARLRVRELDVETALGQYYEGVAASEEITERASARAREILTDAENASSAPRRTAMVAVRRLKELGENQASLVELTGLSPVQVRECLAGDEEPAKGAGERAPMTPEGGARPSWQGPVNLLAQTSGNGDRR